MIPEPNKHFHRTSIRLMGYDYSAPGAYFVTLCAYRRQCMFGEIKDKKIILNEFGTIVWQEWIKSAEIRSEITLDECVVMPNHIHGIVFINHTSVGAFVAGFKSIVTKRINELRQLSGNPVWQRNYYERVIRDEQELNRWREYIIHNPANWARDQENPDARNESIKR